MGNIYNVKILLILIFLMFPEFGATFKYHTHHPLQTTRFATKAFCCNESRCYFFKVNFLFCTFLFLLTLISPLFPFQLSTLCPTFVHFHCITEPQKDDATIYQMVDMNHAAWHAGSRKGNLASVGVEISNAYYPKYQDWYKRNGFGERPLVEGASVHGRSMDPFLDFYPVQIEALKALWEACHNALEIPYKCPLDKEGNTLMKVSTSAAAARFKGFVSHYHLTGRKIDCANLDINDILKDLK